MSQRTPEPQPPRPPRSFVKDKMSKQKQKNNKEMSLIKSRRVHNELRHLEFLKVRETKALKKAFQQVHDDGVTNWLLQCNRLNVDDTKWNLEMAKQAFNHSNIKTITQALIYWAQYYQNIEKELNASKLNNNINNNASKVNDKKSAKRSKLKKAIEVKKHSKDHSQQSQPSHQSVQLHQSYQNIKIQHLAGQILSHTLFNIAKFLPCMEIARICEQLLDTIAWSCHATTVYYLQNTILLILFKMNESFDRSYKSKSKSKSKYNSQQKEKKQKKQVKQQKADDMDMDMGMNMDMDAVAETASETAGDTTSSTASTDVIDIDTDNPLDYLSNNEKEKFINELLQITHKITHRFIVYTGATAFVLYTKLTGGEATDASEATEENKKLCDDFVHVSYEIRKQSLASYLFYLHDFLQRKHEDNNAKFLLSIGQMLTYSFTITITKDSYGTTADRDVILTLIEDIIAALGEYDVMISPLFLSRIFERILVNYCSVDNPTWNYRLQKFHAIASKIISRGVEVQPPCVPLKIPLPPWVISGKLFDSERHSKLITQQAESKQSKVTAEAQRLQKQAEQELSRLTNSLSLSSLSSSSLASSSSATPQSSLIVPMDMQVD